MSIIRNIEDTEIGWISPEGDVFGVKSYIAGSFTHIWLADAICNHLNVKAQNTSSYLEKRGYVKYTTDFIIKTSDKKITNKQLVLLKRFVNLPNKLKTCGKIRIGTYLSPHITIEEFNKLDIYTFELYNKY